MVGELHPASHNPVITILSILCDLFANPIVFDLAFLSNPTRYDFFKKKQQKENALTQHYETQNLQK